MHNGTGVGEVLKEMPDDQVTDSLRKLCFLQVQHLNQVRSYSQSSVIYLYMHKKYYVLLHCLYGSDGTIICNIIFHLLYYILTLVFFLLVNN